MTLAYVLGYYTQMPIVPFYFAVQALELIKGVIGFVLVKKGVWIRNIVVVSKGEEQVC